jgi:hypothetical protein
VDLQRQCLNELHSDSPVACRIAAVREAGTAVLHVNRPEVPVAAGDKASAGNDEAGKRADPNNSAVRAAEDIRSASVRSQLEHTAVDPASSHASPNMEQDDPLESLGWVSGCGRDHFAAVAAIRLRDASDFDHLQISKCRFL